MDTNPVNIPRRMALGRLYRSTGVFFWGQRLKELGIVSPVRQIYVIGQTLAESAEHELPEVTASPQDWVLRALSVYASKYFQSEVEPLHALADRVGSLVQWDPHEELAELMAVECGPVAMRSTRAKLRSKGFRVDYPELHDLAAIFATRHLKPALASFDAAQGEGKEAAWLSTVFYRYSLRHVLTSRRLNESLSDAFEIADSSYSPEVVLDRLERDQALSEIPRQLSLLTPIQRDAVTLYFGMDGQEHTLAEVASRLSTNVYFARMAVASGVGSIAASLGISGLLEHDELNLAHLIFTEGCDAEAAAQVLGLPVGEVRRRASRIGQKLRKAFRTRTSASHTLTSREISMAQADETALLNFVQDFLSGQITVFRDDQGDLLATRKGSTASSRVAPILAALRNQPTLLDRLVDSSSEEILSELFSPDGSEVRTDLMTDYAEWDQLLQQASSGSLANAAHIYESWEETCSAAGLSLSAVDRARDIEGIRSSLSAVTSGLEEVLPWDSRVKGSAILQIQLPTQNAGAAQAYWGMGMRLHEAEPLDLEGLLRDRLDLVGKFSGARLDSLTSTILSELSSQTSTLPGFVPIEPQHGVNRVAYRWTRPDLQRD